MEVAAGRIIVTIMAHKLSLLAIAVCLPFILWAVCGILPTFDDFTTLQSPWWVQLADPGYFFADSVRRPFDALLGAIVGWQPALFPTLNHVLIILGHAANALLVFVLCRRLRIGEAATNIATLFFFFSPATLGVTLACDGFNQTFAQFWGLIALLTYLSGLQAHGFRRHAWLLCVVMAVLSKENGLAWAAAVPIVAYAFRQTGLRRTAADIARGLLVAVAYFAVLFLLIQSGIVPIDYPEEYTEATFMAHLKDFVQLMAYTWVPLDYMSAVYAPSRNLAVVAVTALLGLPFLLMLASRWRLLLVRPVLVLVVCFFVLVSPHLVTVVSIMHNYAALAIAALTVAVLADSIAAESKASKWLALTFTVYMAAALFTDIRHCVAARESGLLGKRLAMQAIEDAGRPLRKAMVISIYDPAEPCYSSFRVRPADAFGWGLSVRHYTGYEWKTAISEAEFDHYDPQLVKAVADSALRAGCEAVWVVGHRPDSLSIITPQPRIRQTD